MDNLMAITDPSPANVSGSGADIIEEPSAGGSTRARQQPQTSTSSAAEPVALRHLSGTIAFVADWPVSR